MIVNNSSIAIVNGNECDVSCLKYKIMLWRQFCNIVDLTSLELIVHVVCRLRIDNQYQI